MQTIQTSNKKTFKHLPKTNKKPLFPMTPHIKFKKHKLLLTKPTDGTGLLLKTNQLGVPTEKLIFSRACFNRIGNYLAAATPDGHILILNFTVQKWWLLSYLDSCTALKFSPLADTEIVAALRDGCVKVFDVDNAIEITTLKNHKYPVKEISFSCTKQCLTASKVEAVIWDMKTWSVLKVLTLETNCFMKHIMFVRVSGDILACFHDDIIHVWKSGSLDSFKQILPAKWNKFSLKSITITRNGRCILIGGRSPFITIFFLENWSLYQTLYLPSHIKSVKQMDFIPRIFDDGTSSLLCILAGNGIIYVYNMHESAVLFEIGATREIINFSVANTGNNVACVLCTGEVCVYDVTELLCTEKEKTFVTVTAKKKPKIVKSVQFKQLIPQEQVAKVFDIEKLQTILKQYEQYPDAYRAKIWEHILQLPCNSQIYNIIIKHPVYTKFGDLEKEFPLVNKMAMQNLKRTLNNLITWCSFFGHVKYLPLFIFPFVKVFHAVPVLCFEAVVTIIINWCQHWFEYFPLPPMNILGMIENILLEHDPRLLDHLMKNDVPSTIYAWSLLKVAFSETFSAQEWQIFWDHVLINEPAFLLMGVAAYSIVNRSLLFSLSNPSEFFRFYHTQNIPDMKLFIAKTYQLLKGTSDRNHPRKYLSAFKSLEVGKYPSFTDYPKSLIEFKESALSGFADEQEEIELMRKSISLQKNEIVKSMQSFATQEEQSRRLKELENIYHEKIEEEQKRILQERQKLIEMQKQLHDEEVEKLAFSRDKLLEKSVKEKCATLERLIKTVDSNKLGQKLEMEKAESNYLLQRKELLALKAEIEQFLQPSDVAKYTAHSSVFEQQKAFTQEIRKVIEKAKSQPILKRFSIVTGLAAIEDLIEAVELELAREVSEKFEKNKKEEAGEKIKDLRVQAEQMEKEVFALRTLLEQAKIAESQKVTELFKARASVMEEIAAGISARAMQGVTDGFSAPPASLEES